MDGPSVDRGSIMVGVALRLLPWIAGAASIAGVLIWAQQAGVRLAVHEQTSEQLRQVQDTLANRVEQEAREWAIIEKHLLQSRAARERLALTLRKIDELETPDCTSLGPEWVGLYNASNR